MASTTSHIELEDLFYDYASATTVGSDGVPYVDPRVLTSSYKEYTNETTPARLTPLPQGFFFPYQEQQARYMLQYGKDKVCGFLDPGTGKTFIAGLISEMLRGYYNPSLPQDPITADLPDVVKQYVEPTRTNIKRCVYLTVNHVLDRDAMNAIPIIKAAPGLTREDEAWYTSRSFGTFLTPYTKQFNTLYDTRYAWLIDDGVGVEAAREGAEAYASEQLAVVFRAQGSDTFYVIDEAHRLPGENLQNIINGDNMNYKLIRLMLKSVERSKVVVFTATPMNNSTNEIIPVLNLILDYEDEIPLKSTDLDKMSDAEIQKLVEQKCKDNIFYVSANPAGIVPEYQGVPLEGTPFSYDRCYMEGKQLEQYIAASQGELIDYTVQRGSEGLDTEDLRRDSLYTAETMASLCWAPLDKSVQERREGKLVSIRKPVSIILPPDSPIIRQMAAEWERRVRSTMEKTRRTQERYAGHVREMVDAQPYLFDTERMATYGEKPENWRVDGPKGNNLRQRSAKYYEILKEMYFGPGDYVCLVYFRFLVGSGMESFVAIAILNGYERYDDTLSDVVAGGRIVGLEKKKRFIVLTPNMKSATVRLWLNIVKHPDNAFGEYINMVIISPGMKVGISVFSVQRYFHTGPEWSPWGELQSLYRGIREGGAEAVLRRRGTWPEGEMVIRISCQCAMIDPAVAARYPPKNRAFMSGIKLPNRDHLTTLDEDQYLRLGDKYKRHLRVLGPVRNVSVGCNLNRERNGPSVVCRPPLTGDPLIVNAFNNLYGRRYVWALKNYLRSLLSKNRDPIHLGDILSRTRSYQIPLILYDRAIAEIISEREPIMSELGVPLYPGFDKERLFLQQSFSLATEGSIPVQDYHMSWYANFVPITYSAQREEPTYKLTSESRKALLAVPTARLRAYIRTNHPTVEEQTIILETAMEETYKAGEFPDGWRKGPWRRVLELYYVYWGFFPLPIQDNIAMAHSFISFWHEAGYPIIARLRVPSRYRYFALRQKEWTTTLERTNLVATIRTVYSEDKVRELFTPVEELGFPIGIDTICDGQFRVVLRSADSGPGIRGRMVTAFSYLELVYVLYLLGWADFPSDTIGDHYNRDDLEDELREEISIRYGEEAGIIEEDIVDLANIVAPHFTRKDLVAIVRRTLEDGSRVILA